MVNKISLVIRYLAYLFCDVLAFIVTIFDRIDEYSSYKLIDETSIHNLMQFNYKEEFRLEWKKTLLFTCIDLEDIDVIYRLQSTIYVPRIYKTITYYVEHGFWSLLNFHMIDTYNFSNDEYYNDILMNKGLQVYYVKAKEKKIVLLATVYQGQLEYIYHYNKKVSLYKIRDRQVVYEREKNICII